MTTPSRRHQPIPTLIAVSLCTLAALPLHGQSSAPAPASATEASVEIVKPPEDTVVMSPFIVEADDNDGYRASNTLSGTRINARLEDLGAAITVVTKQQLEDTAAVDLNDIFLYEANTEGMNQFASFSVDQNGRVRDTAQDNPAGANRVRGLGAVRTSVGGFATASRVPVDTYNLDSLEISRGPNSNLFGLGDAAGTVNLNQAQGMLGRTAAQVQFRVDDRGGRRGSLNFNLPVYKDVFALRYAALYDSKGFIRKPSHDTQKRHYLAATLRPFRTTTIRASVEYFEQRRRTPNTQTPRDMVTEWMESGQPTWDPVTFRARVNGVQTAPIPIGSGATSEGNVLPRGLGVDSTTYSRPSMWISDGELELWMINRTSSNANVGAANTNVRVMGTFTDIIRQRANLYPLFISPAINNRELYDWENINFVSTNWNRDFAEMYSASLDQVVFSTPFHGLFLQAAGRFENWEQLNRNLIGDTAYMHIDIHERLIDGSPNPYLHRPYVAVWEPTITRPDSQSDAGRLQVNYDINFTQKDGWLKWLGRHRAVGFFEESIIAARTRSSREQMLDNHSWVNPADRASATGRASLRYYMGDNEGFNIDSGPPLSGDINGGTYPFRYWNNPTASWVTENAHWGEAPSGASKSENGLQTTGVNLQSYFLKDRIVVTLGTRNDKQRVRTGRSTETGGGAVVDPSTGWSDWTSIDRFWSPWTIRQGDTFQRGVVVKPLSWLNLHYNESDSFVPAGIAKNLLGDVLANPNGQGNDYGVSVSLFDNKLFAKVNWYKSEQKDARVQGGASTVVGRSRNIDWGTSSFNLEDWGLLTILPATYRSQGIDPLTVSAEKRRSDLYALMQFPEGFIDEFEGFGTSDVNDITSKGIEFEVTYNPTRSLRFKLTAAKNETIDENLSPTTQQYLDERLPIWTSIRAPGTDGLMNTADDTDWWTASTANNWYNGLVVPLVKLARASVGLPRTQNRTWTASAIGNYDIQEGRFAGFGLGGGLRFQDQASIGFFGLPVTSGPILEYDPNRPIYDDRQIMVDLTLSYRFRLMSDKVRGRLQINGRDIFSTVELRPFGANPDGQPHSYRIYDGPQWMLTTTFDL